MNKVWKFVDFLLTSIGILVFVVIVGHYVPSFKRGFWCDDPSLKLSFNGDTIPELALVVILILGIPIIFLVDEKIYGFQNTFDSIIGYLRGRFITGAITYSLQCLVGEHRPYFFEDCQPDSALNCSLNTFVEDYICINPKVRIHTSKSFPSGHAAFAMFQSVFFVFYLERRFLKYRQYMYILSTIIILWGFYVGVSRVTDNRHHWWDVVAGLLIGAGIAVYTIRIYLMAKTDKTDG